MLIYIRNLLEGAVTKKKKKLSFTDDNQPAEERHPNVKKNSHSGIQGRPSTISHRSERKNTKGKQSRSLRKESRLREKVF